MYSGALLNNGRGDAVEFIDLIKVYGPLGLGWVAALYLLKFVLSRYEADIESRVKLSTALDGLRVVIENLKHD